MADARSETTIDDERVRVTTWSFEKAGDSTGAHVHEYDYVLVPVTGGTLTAVSTTDGSARTITQVAGSPYTGQAGLAHTVTADADGIVFVEVEPRTEFYPLWSSSGSTVRSRLPMASRRCVCVRWPLRRA